MDTKKKLQIVIFIAAITTIFAGIAFGRAKVLSAKSYNPQMCANIAGWDWIRRPGAQATWIFDAEALQSADMKKVYLNIEALATNGVSGGSGYDTTVKVSVVGKSSFTSTVHLINPYRPQDPDDSQGVGYRVYGHSTIIPQSLIKDAKDISVTIMWPTVDSNHVAVNKDSVTIGYIK